MKYKLAIFDLDGTILDTIEDLTDSVNFSLQECSYPIRTITEIRSFVGNGIRKLIERSLPPGIPESEIDRVHGIFAPYYKEHCNVKTHAYDGTHELLRTLRENGIKTAVLSNKADFAVQPLIRQYFDGLFDMVLGERAGVPRKPAPDGIYDILEHFQAEKSDTVYIGDSNVDIETARNAGIPCISVDWGFRDRSHLLECGAETIVSSPMEIAALLFNL